LESNVFGLESIEQDAWRRLAEIMPPELARGIGFECEPMGEALFMMAARIPAFQFNWLAGAGLKSDDSDEVGRAVARFRAAGQMKFIIQVPPGPYAAHVVQRAKSEGLAEHPLAWAKFVRDADEPPQGGFAAHVREVGVDEADLFAATVVAGFGMPPPIARWVREIVGLPGWRCFLSELDGSPVGGGALFVRGDFAWLGIGATKPEARKRGSQSALIARRISAARRDGARWIVTETGVPQPGQPAQSYKNILAAGFKVAYVRPNWSPA